MKTLLLPLAALFVITSGVSLAADSPQHVRPLAACRADVQKFCADVQPGQSRIANCLRQNAAQVSAECRDAIARAHERKAAPPPAPQG